MVQRISALLLVLALVLFVTMGASVRSTQAAPVGAAMSLSANAMGCAADGTVSGNFTWFSSGWGTQYVDVSKFNDAFQSGYGSIGPFGPEVGFTGFAQLQPSTAYFARVNTASAAGWLPSDTLVFTTPSCGGGGAVFTPPTNLNAFALSSNALRFAWNPGSDNVWYCVDTAKSTNDLFSFSSSWANHACFTSATVVDVSGLDCGTLYYWRVFAWGSSNSGHSGVSQVSTLGCPASFSAPSNLSSNVISGDQVSFNWNRGQSNDGFCVDVAENTTDLVNINGSFRNYGCGTTGTSVTASGLNCDTTYVWRVFAFSTIGTGYSGTASVHTGACAFSVPTHLDVDVVSPTAAFFQWQPGSNNDSFCVDVAKTRNDLIFFGETWRNYGCGTDDDDLYVATLECNTEYFWRVYAVADRGASTGHSAIDRFEMDNCATDGNQGGGR